MILTLTDKKLTVQLFSEGKLHSEPTWKEFIHTIFTEFPKDCYIHDRGNWYRADLTPVLLDDVPKEYRTWMLIL